MFDYNYYVDNDVTLPYVVIYFYKASYKLVVLLIDYNPNTTPLPLLCQVFNIYATLLLG